MRELQADRIIPGLSSLDRTVILGTGCAGKSTLAAVIAASLQSTHVELDALFWEPQCCGVEQEGPARSRIAFDRWERQVSEVRANDASLFHSRSAAGMRAAGIRRINNVASRSSESYVQ
jgi:broad-specificity NMP kinase